MISLSPVLSLCSMSTTPSNADLKQQGNESFARRDYVAAVDFYTQSLDSTDVTTSTTARLRLQLYANRSLAFLRLGCWAKAAADGERAEKLCDDGDECYDTRLVFKAVYRRAVALCMLGDERSVEAGVACMTRLGRLRDVDVKDEEDMRLLLDAFDVLKSAHAKEDLADAEVRRLVEVLWKDVLGEEEDDEEEEEEDVNEPIDRLIKLIDDPQGVNGLSKAHQKIANCLHIVSNPRLLVYLASTPSTCRAACRLLAATACVGIVWPREIWSFLVSYACGKKREDVGEDVAGACMGVLLAVARRDAFAREWLLGRCWEAGSGRINETDGIEGVLDGMSVVTVVSGMVATCHLWTRRVGAEAVASGCGVLAYAGHGRADVVMPILSAFENAKEIVWGSGDGVDGIDGGDVGQDGEEEAVRDGEDEEARAKRALIKKQRAVYDPKTVDLQKEILGHLKTVFASKSSVMSELVEWKGGRQVASQVHHRLVALGKMLVGKCPRRSTKVYDGQLHVASYEKRPYAADYNDNPAGDFLATIDLAGLASAAGKDLTASTVLDEFLETVMVLLDHKLTFVSGLLYKAGAISLCESLAAFSSPSTVALAQRICTRLLHDTKEAKGALMESSNVVLLAGVLVNGVADVGTFALGELACAVPSCSGNDLRYLIEKESGVLAFLNDALSGESSGAPTSSGKSAEKIAAVRLTAELAKRTVACGSSLVLRSGRTIPKGYGWGCFDTEVLETVMYAPARLIPAEPGADAGQLGAGFARGFFPKKGGTDVAGVREDKAIDQRKTDQQMTPDAKETTPSSARCEIVEIIDIDSNDASQTVKEQAVKEHAVKEQAVTDSSTPGIHAAHAAHAAHTIPADQAGINIADDDSDDGCEVHEVYDSTPASEIREARAAWMSMDKSEKITWEQTSSDVVAKIKVPKGITSAKDVTVTCTSTSITVDLKWYGKILQGDLFGGIKAHEFTWCLNDDSEIYIVLPKDSREHWWKTLIQGWEEKGYYELLKDAVDADEPHVAYDDMDEGAKDLLDSMLERQAYINAGMLDLENGFDDFRIVLSDSSLGETNKT